MSGSVYKILDTYKNDDPNTGYSLLEQYEIPAQTVLERIQVVSQLVFLLNGSCRLYKDEQTSYTIESNSMFAIPKRVIYRIHILKITQLIVFRFSYNTLLSRYYPDLHNEAPVQPASFNELPINNKLLLFLRTTKTFLDDGITSASYCELKHAELMHLLQKYYSKEEIASLLNPIMTPDKAFSDFVVENHHKVKTVEQLAELSNHSLSTFKKRFKECFGKPPYKWMKEQKAKSIYSDIAGSDSSLKEISDRYDFSAMSQLTAFCKANFNQTPSQIRKTRLR